MDNISVAFKSTKDFLTIHGLLFSSKNIVLLHF